MLDTERQRRLDEIGFEWGLANVSWDATYALLQQFKKREGHCKVPQSHTEDGANLGRWVKTQRHLTRKEKLAPERQKRLEEIGFEWGLTSATWDKTYAILQQFKRREGHCNVPQSYTEDGANLGVWATHQRQLNRKEMLDPERQKRLEEIGFERGLTYAATWDETYALLQQFKKREGHCKVPQSHTEDGANLGMWMNTQRHLKKKESLDPERQKRLEEIGLEWGLARATWDESYTLLQQFKKREGHCNVPQSHSEDGANLGIWVNNQRQLKKKETLDPERQNRLEEIGFEWGLANVTWDEKYLLLKRFQEREGHCKVPRSHTEDGANLGMWMSTQRQRNRKEMLDPKRQKRLEEICFEWGTIQEPLHSLA
jgi:AraC-like DNA-binding protein